MASVAWQRQCDIQIEQGKVNLLVLFDIFGNNLSKEQEESEIPSTFTILLTL